MYTRENAPLTPEQRKHLDNVVANSRLEGYELTDQNIDDVIRIILGEKTSDEIRDEILQRYGVSPHQIPRVIHE
ncbi:antitoxin VbhA family protein [Corynebacterium matruchotii]|uniref:antitoxin VbhA family protein n=1 Tax=Corynebacterium matruchotii TaxID=43768 RepID=UPI00361AC92A